MTHRAQQIVDSIKTALESNVTPGWTVYRHRTASLDRSELELPAASVTIGPDHPLDSSGQSNLAFIDGLLELAVILVDQKSTEEDLMESLLEMRRQAHITVLTDRTQGLAFVIDTRYGGADAPNISANGSMFDGEIHTRWAVHYRMNLADPA